MKQQHALRVRDDDDDDASTAEIRDDRATAVDAAVELESVYDRAGGVDLRQYGSYSVPKFVTAVLAELGRDFTADDARLVDAIGDSEDVDFGLLLVYPDETLLFVGSDPTAKDSIPWFAFSIGRHEPLPAPTSAQEALDLLKPPGVRDLVHEDGYLPPRHGEWWLTPTDLVPTGTVFRPGVASKPYGPSPLGNHVPREFAFTTNDDAFMTGFHEAVPSAPNSVRTPPEAIRWSWRQLQKAAPPPETPDWTTIRELAGDVLVRGTIRHRDDDHYVEQLGDRWHTATTHDVEVYTGDQIATNIHRDYHGG